MANKKYTDIATGTAYTDSVILVANPVTGALKRVTVAQLLAASGTEPGGGGDVTAPTVVSATVQNAAPNQVVVVFSESVTVTTAGWSFRRNAASWAISSVAGSGTTWTFTMATSAASGETIDRSYNPATGATVDGSANELASFTNSSVTNNVAGYDADAQAYFDVLTTPTTPYKDAVNTFIVGLKTDSIWAKVEAGYILTRGSLAECKWNFKNPLDTDGARRLTQAGTVTFASTGATPSASSGLRTHFVPSGTLADNNSFAITCYINTNSTSGEADMGFDSSGSGSAYLLVRTPSDLPSCPMYDTSQSIITGSVTDSTGAWTLSRTASNSLKLYRNGTQVGTTSTGTAGSPPANYMVGICGYATQSGSTPNMATTGRELKFAIITTGLSDSEVSNLHTRINTLVAAL